LTAPHGGNEVLSHQTQKRADNAWSNVISPIGMNRLGRATLFNFLIVRSLFSHLVGGMSGLLSLGFFVSGYAAESGTGAKALDLSNLSIEALMELEVPKVYGASKFEQKTTEAPSSISIISSDEIKKYGYQTLADLLQSVPGLHVSYDRNYAFLGVRGINLGDFNNRALLLVDGHRINNNLTDGAFIGSAFILDVDLIDRVEIIRGPGSVLYGNNAFLGVISVVTRQGRHIDGIEGSVEYGAFETYKARLTAGELFTNGVEFLVSGSFYNSAGPDELFYQEFNTPAQNNGIATSKDDDLFWSLFGSLSYKDFTLEGAFIHREKGNPTAQYFTTFNDSRLRTTDDRGYAVLKYAHSFTDVLEVSARLYYDQSDFRIGYPQQLQVGTNLIDASSSEKDLGEWWGTELQLNKRVWERHMVTLGGEYRDDFQQEQRLSGQPAKQQDRQSFGVFAQGDFALMQNLHLNGGVRYDHYSDFEPSVNPRVALIYQPFKQSTFKAIYGTAFRAPNFLELALSPSPDQLQPEEITAYELIYEQEVNRHIRTSISGFYNQIDGLIAFQNGGFTNFNADTGGMEVAMEGFWTNVVRGRFSYSLQKTESQSLGLEMPDSPLHMIKLNLTVPLWKDKIFAGLEYQYTSQRESFHNTTEPRTVQGETVHGYGVFNLTLFSRDIVKNLEFSASIYNLFNQEYFDPATRFHAQDMIEQDGRTFRLKLSYRF
jgi:iron complex outermembrane receptor protein